MILGFISSTCVSIKTKMQLYANSTHTIKYNNTTSDFILHVTFSFWKSFRFWLATEYYTCYVKARIV